jgi:membrane protein
VVRSGPGGPSPIFRAEVPHGVSVRVVASLGSSWYVANFASYNATYGALAGVVVLLFYFFISAAILLLGAELNAELYHRAFEDESPEEGEAEDNSEA